jgi:hypothetical protein
MLCLNELAAPHFHGAADVTNWMIFGMLFEVNSSMVGAFTLCDTPMVFLSA